MKLALLALVVMGVLLVAGCAVQTTAPEPKMEKQTEMESTNDAFVDTQSSVTEQMVLENGRFMPADLEILSGDTVEWVNKDSVRYTIIVGDLMQERLPPGGTATLRFTQEGTFGVEAKGADGEVRAQAIVLVE